MKKIISAFFCLLCAGALFGQQSEWNSARILLEIQKVQNTSTVLYIAAHPDDENTRLITWLSNDVKARTGYLSLTRGDGGQNLIGEEQGALLGVIRTEELLAARATDGGEQFFTRAVDFGYSKTASETFTMWDHDSLLADVVWVIRNFKPDIIITRFPPDERAGHGQHTVSAMIAEEAFTAAADPNMFPEQLQYVQPWQATRLFWNNSSWWDKQLPEKIALGNTDLVALNIGGYNSLLGKSYGEIAAESRTHHKSQGFGSTPVLGNQTEYLERKAGAQISKGDIFSGIATDWNRYRQGNTIDDLLQNILDNYDATDPAASVPALIDLYTALKNMPEDALIRYKKDKVQEIIAACLGLWLEPVALQPMVASGDTVEIVNTCIKRSTYPITLESVAFLDKSVKVGEILPQNVLQLDTIEVVAPYHTYSTPYWLRETFGGLYTVRDQKMIGKPESDPVIAFTYTIKIGDQLFTYTRSAVYKETDAVKGEIVDPLAVVPPVSMQFNAANYFFTNTVPQTIYLHVHKLTPDAQGIITLAHPAGWKVDKEQIEVHADDPENMEWTFSIQPDFPSGAGNISAYFNSGMEKDSYSVQQVKYDHIPKQTIVGKCSAHIIPMQTNIPDKPIGYIEGAGDNVFESLQALGLHITSIDPAGISAEILEQYKVIIIGIRAYNVSNALADAQPLLMQYVQNGGLVIMQYSTNWDNYAEQWGPYPFKITRGRITDENAPVTFALPDHPVLNTPNKITQDDFAGWVQERGIYFAGDMAPEYAAPLSMVDPNEEANPGALIIADYGKGAFIYTGLVFFRELPAGVPGAYRLFINMLSYTPLAH